MQARLSSWFNRLTERWKALERRQKINFIAVSSAVLILFAVLIIWVTRPNYIQLTQTPDAVTAQNVMEALSQSGIASKMSDRGLAVMVKQKDLFRARVVTEELNISALAGFTYADALANSGMGTSSRMVSESLLRAKETELGSTLAIMDGVQSAVVRLVIPDNSSYFLSNNEEASASVLITSNKAISRTQGETMARIVSKGVQNLSLENIVISDQNGNIIFSGEVSDDGTYSTQRDLEAVAKSELESEIRNLLRGTIYDDCQILSYLEFDWDKIIEERFEYDNPSENGGQTGLINTDSTISQSGTSAATGGEPGMGANDATTPTYATGTGEATESSYKERAVDYLYNSIKTYVERGNTGKILTDGSGISIIVTNTKLYNQDYYANNGLLNGMTWEQFKESVPRETKLDVDQDLVNLVRNGTGISNISILAYEKPLFEDAVVKPLQINQIITFVILSLLILMLAYGLLRRAKTDEVTEVEPELSVEDLLVSTQIEEEKERTEAERLKEIEFGKDSEAKRQIEKFVNERPESAAQLLRNWINEDWE